MRFRADLPEVEALADAVEWLERHGVGVLGLRLLAAVGGSEDTTPRALAAQIHRSVAPVAAACERLVSRELLTRLDDQLDTRDCSLRLAPQGKRLLEQLAARLERSGEASTHPEEVPDAG